MKHTFDETTMQAAIDAACEALGKGDFRPTAGLLDTVPGCHDWKEETSTRLHLLKTALANLPEPPPPVVDGKTPGQVNHDAVANGDYDTYKKWSELSERGKRDVERGASAVLAAFGKPQLSTLRPISEAGEVPDGCLRVYGLWRRNKWVITMTCSQDTHCADIRLPESPKEANARAHAEFQAELEAVWNAPEVIRDGGEVLEEAEPVDLHAELKAAHAEGKVIQWHNGHMWHDLSYSENPLWVHPAKDYRIKPTPETFTAHGKEWTPAVGDVVTLKSDGPKMTVLDPHPICYCSWFSNGEFYSNNFPASTLIPA